MEGLLCVGMAITICCCTPLGSALLPPAQSCSLFATQSVYTRVRLHASGYTLYLYLRDHGLEGQ